MTPRLAGANWIVIGWVCPGPSVNAIGPPIRLSEESWLIASTVPDSIPLPLLRSTTVLVALAPAFAASATLRGAASRPGSTFPLIATFTRG